MSIKSAGTSKNNTLSGILKNPLTIYGLILVGGDGPLVVAYSLTQDPQKAWVLLISTILFIFGMGMFFCYLVAFKPRHLYAPDEIPNTAIGKNLYQDPTSSKDYFEEAKKLVIDLTESKSEEQKNAIIENITSRLDSATDIQLAYDLLLLPGYDISVISDILTSINNSNNVNSIALSAPRNITSSTIDIIVDQMIYHKVITKKHELLNLTAKGTRLLSSVTSYLKIGTLSKQE